MRLRLLTVTNLSAVGAGDHAETEITEPEARRIWTNSGEPDSEFCEPLAERRAGALPPAPELLRGNRFVPVDKAIFRPAATVICSVRLTLEEREGISPRISHGRADVLRY